jgi:hypothetical protein
LFASVVIPDSLASGPPCLVSTLLANESQNEGLRLHYRIRTHEQLTTISRLVLVSWFSLLRQVLRSSNYTGLLLIEQFLVPLFSDTEAGSFALMLYCHYLLCWIDSCNKYEEQTVHLVESKRELLSAASLRRCPLGRLLAQPAISAGYFEWA